MLFHPPFTDAWLNCVVGVIKEGDIFCRAGGVLFPSFACFECKMDIFDCRYMCKSKWCARTCVMIQSHVRFTLAVDEAGLLSTSSGAKTREGPWRGV